MMSREIPSPPKAHLKGTSNSSMNHVQRVPNHQFQARPFKATLPLRPPQVTSLQHPYPLQFKAAQKVIRIRPLKKVPGSQRSSAECNPLQLPRLPTPMTEPLQPRIPHRHRLLRPHLAISSPALISPPPPASRKTPQLFRPLQLQPLFQIPFQPSRSSRASAPFEIHPTPRVLRALTFRSAA
jgi:hypothetical protein